MRLHIRVRALILLAMLLVCRSAFAQNGAIAGVVKDTTGAVLPGVTVEAASPALIERVRTGVSDDQGQYKIVDLRPGIYSVTFALPGFSTVRREGIELSAAFTANISVELKVGDVSETVIVSGESPVVDIQNVTQRTVITRSTIDNLPTGRSFQALAVLTPGIVVAGAAVPGLQDVGGTVGDRQVYLSVHGSRGREMPLLLDGLRYNNMLAWGGGGESLYHVNSGTVQEFTMEVSGMGAEAQVSGARVNVIPKEGGNTFRGSVYGVYTGDELIADNVPDDVKATGASFGTYENIWDFVPSFGGPIVKDRIWFLSAARRHGTREAPPNTFYDLNPLDFVYTPDRSRPAFVTIPGWSVANRVTWQALPKHKFSGFYDRQGGAQCPSALSSTVAPEGAECRHYTSVYVGQATWTGTITNRLLLDAGTAVFNQLFHSRRFLDAEPTYSVLELSTNTRFRAPTLTAPVSLDRAYNGKTNLTYVTGSHAMKMGVQWQHGYNRTETVEAYNSFLLTTLNGVANSVTISTAPYERQTNLKRDIALFAQDQWTVRRLTFNMGVRLDHVNAYTPETHLPPVRYVGARDFAAIPNVPNWYDVSPRFGTAWDVFGTGRTAVKVSLGRYVVAVTNGISGAVHPINASVNTTSRPWTDRNGDFIPQESELGPYANANFGRTIITTRWDPEVTEGFGKRPYNWEGSAGIQHEFRPGLGLNFAYFHRAAGNLLVNDNLLVTPEDYDTYCITTPVDARLPGGGGQRICDLYDIKPPKFGQFDNLVTSPDNFGDGPTEVWDGVDLSVNLRLGAGATLQGGFSTGRIASNSCDIVTRVNNAGAPVDGGRSIASLFSNASRMPSPSSLYCDNVQPLQTQGKLLGIYPLPFWGLQFSATFQSLPGPEIFATYVATNAQIAPSLGRNLSGGATTATIEIIEPNSQYRGRINQLDSRVAKTLSAGRFRMQGWIDVYNLLNASPVLTHNTRYGPAWLTPHAVLPGRLFKFGGQFDF
jgi:hypothetical protein